VLSGKSEGSAELILKAKFTITPEASGLPFTMLKVKYPLIPAYCLYGLMLLWQVLILHL